MLAGLSSGRCLWADLARWQCSALQSIGDWVDYFLANSPLVATVALSVLTRVPSPAAVREVMNSRTSQGSIAWIMSLLLVPFPDGVSLSRLRHEGV
jgi:hypothetical protein